MRVYVSMEMLPVYAIREGNFHIFSLKFQQAL